MAKEPAPIDVSKLGIRVPLCAYCGSSKRQFQGFPENAHFGIPVYETNLKNTPHICMASLVCDNCGHVEFFSLRALEALAKRKMSDGGGDEPS